MISGASWKIKPESYSQGTSREWIISNGMGGYASSTSILANTRAYHGLLVAAISPPTNRMLLLSSLDEEIISDKKYQLANHQYPGAICPQGFALIQQVSFDPFPQSLYQAGNAKVEKTVFMVHGENTTIVNYAVSQEDGQEESLMKIVPLVTCRSFHAATDLPVTCQEQINGGTLLKSSSALSGCDLLLLSDKARYVKEELVYYNFEYQEERQRGLPWRENCFCPGYFEIELGSELSFNIMASTKRRAIPVSQRLLMAEQKRLESLSEKLERPLKRLAQAADSFIVKRGDGKSIIAGYHWFDDWGRDAMISLPGLMLVTGRFEDAKSVLLNFAKAMRQGVLPNDLGAGSYNTADASLWFIQAAFSYFECTNDRETIRLLWPKMQQVIEHYSGASPYIRLDGDSLIVCAPALTWMDAQVDGKPVTPRAGKACEINALWYSSLRKMERLAEALGQPWDGSLADRVKQSYQKFWNSETGCLFDVLDHEDASIRPNQIIAAAIPDLLPELKRKSILEVVTIELLTPYGLRTLSPRDPRYKGTYEGGPRQRDEAYHQGTVWPWLMGHYIDAYLSVNGYSGQSKASALKMLEPLVNLDAGGINNIPEVFDGDAPHRPGGCISQAWSVGEVMRAWMVACNSGK
jgi:predicted glycogen debranching enzyme